jgi:outer membrane protein TolC
LVPGGPGIDIGNVGSPWTSLGQLFSGTYPVYSAGVQLVLPLRNRIAQADYTRDLITVRQAAIRNQQLENQVRLEIESALVVLQRSRASLDAAVQSRVLQEQSLEIEQEKYAVGLSTNYLILQYQSYVAQARSTEVAARGTYVKAREALERALGETLENHNISIEDAYRGRPH